MPSPLSGLKLSLAVVLARSSTSKLIYEILYRSFMTAIMQMSRHAIHLVWSPCEVVK